MAVFDSNILLHLLDPQLEAPIDTQTGSPVAEAPSRVEALVESLQARQEVIIVPAPVLSEVLVHANDAAPFYLEILSNTSRFRIVPFEERAAIELAEMTRQAHDKGDLRAGTDATRAQFKFDRQILAIARVERENLIYTDDRKLRTFARAAGFQVKRLQDLPLPNGQTALPIADGDPTAKPDSSE